MMVTGESSVGPYILAASHICVDAYNMVRPEFLWVDLRY